MNRIFLWFYQLGKIHFSISQTQQETPNMDTYTYKYYIHFLPRNHTFLQGGNNNDSKHSSYYQQCYSINKDDTVLIIDDLIATGGTAEAAAKLIEISRGKVAAFIFVINLFDLNGSDNLIKNNYKVENLIDFPGH